MILDSSIRFRILIVVLSTNPKVSLQHENLLSERKIWVCIFGKKMAHAKCAVTATSFIWRIDWLWIRDVEWHFFISVPPLWTLKCRKHARDDNRMYIFRRIKMRDALPWVAYSMICLKFLSCGGLYWVPSSRMVVSSRPWTSKFFCRSVGDGRSLNCIQATVAID